MMDRPQGPMTRRPGSSLGPYGVLAPLGAGGMGEVYRAKDRKLGRDVALKELPPAFAKDPARLDRRVPTQVLAEHLAMDGRTSADTVLRNLSQLYLIRGLR